MGGEKSKGNHLQKGIEKGRVGVREGAEGGKTRLGKFTQTNEKVIIPK